MDAKFQATLEWTKEMARRSNIVGGVVCIAPMDDKQYIKALEESLELALRAAQPDRKSVV